MQVFERLSERAKPLKERDLHVRTEPRPQSQRPPALMEAGPCAWRQLGLGRGSRRLLPCVEGRCVGVADRSRRCRAPPQEANEKYSGAIEVCVRVYARVLWLCKKLPRALSTGWPCEWARTDAAGAGFFSILCALLSVPYSLALVLASSCAVLTRS